MSAIQSLYNQLFAGLTLEIQCGSREEFDTLRTALVKKNSFMKELGATDESQSVLASYDKDSGIGKFTLGRSRNSKALNRWKILAIDGKPTEDNQGE